LHRASNGEGLMGENLPHVLTTQ